MAIKQGDCFSRFLLPTSPDRGATIHAIIPGTDQTLAKHWQAVAWSAALIVGLAWSAWTSRWEPALAFELEKMEFFLVPGNAADPPEVICSAEVRVINSGSAVFLPRGSGWLPVPPVRPSLGLDHHRLLFLSVKVASTKPRSPRERFSTAPASR